MFPTYRAGSVLERVWRGAVGLAAVAGGLVVRRPDLVHLKLASRGSFARKIVVGALSRARGVPVLVHVHGGGFDRFVTSAPAPVRAMARWLLEGNPRVLSLSERWAERLRPLFPRARIEVLSNPVEVERFADLARERFEAHAGGAAPPPRALFLGELVERKGVYDLVAAWAEVARAVPGARLVMAGNGEIERVRRAAADAGVAGLVDTPGWVGPEEKRRLLREATLFVLPSFIEGVPISLLEAMAAGLPSVVTPVGGVLDAVTDRQEALVVAPGDRPGLARAIVQVFESPALARALGGTARLRVEAFDVVAYADRLDAIYRELIGRPAGAPRGGDRQAAPAPSAAADGRAPGTPGAAGAAGAAGALRHEAAR